MSFPFSAVVGHDDAKLALLVNAVDPRVGGVLLRGEKGSAKSTLARGLAALLPGKAPFVELPVGATEDRVVGSIDLEAALTTGRQRFCPGLLASADGGVLYVDEVNLLPDHLVDVLLDVAASGVNRVEREGVSESHPARFVLVGSMNPEEGELRPQLLDRFGLSVDVAASTAPEQRAEAVRRRLAHDADPEAFSAAWAPAQAALAARLAAAGPAALPPEVVDLVSRLCAEAGAEGLRADLAICRASAALAGWEGRAEAGLEDVRRLAPLALAHRRRGPFDAPGIERAELDAALDRASAQAPAPPAPPAPPSPAPPAPPSSDSPRPGPEGAPAPGPAADGMAPGDGGPAGAGGGAPGAQRDPVAPGAPGRVVLIDAGRAGASEAAPGRRSPSTGRRGHLVGDRVPTGSITSVALGATARAAAWRRAADPGGALVAPADLREPVREQRVGNLVVLAVDASASMGAEARMEAVKGAVLSLLLDAYQRRDRVSLVTFRGDGADIALRPTGSVEVARARLAGLPTGGLTPLAAGIRAALGVAGTAGPLRPLLVLVSDGRATAAPDGGDPLEAAYAAAGEVRRRGVASVVVDVEDGPVRLGLAAEVAARMGARHLTLSELSADALTGALRQAVAR